jgi:hypothetical protein
MRQMTASGRPEGNGQLPRPRGRFRSGLIDFKGIAS